MPDVGNTPQARHVPCLRNHPLPESYYGKDSKWHCRACRRVTTARWEADHPDAVAGNRRAQDARRALPPEQRMAHRLAAGSTAVEATGCRRWDGRGLAITWRGKRWPAGVLAYYLATGEACAIVRSCGRPRCVEVGHMTAGRPLPGLLAS